jgi:hypothetical protein
MTTYRIGSKEARQSVDGLVLHDGDVVLLAPGETSQTVSGISTGASNLTVKTDGTPPHLVNVTNPKAHLVAFGSTAKNCVVSDVVVNSGASAVSFLKGSNNTARNVTQVGTGPAADWLAATDLAIDHCDSTNGNLKTYGLYGGGVDGQSNNGIKITGVKFAMTGGGEHCIRQHVTNHLVIADTELTYASPYKGATFNIKEGDDVQLLRCTSKNTVSGMGFGPLSNPDSPDTGTERLTNLVIDSCTFDNYSYVDFWPGVVGFVVKDTTIKSQSVACVNIEGPWKTRPKATGSFLRVKFYGDPAKVPVIKGDQTGITFLDCQYNDKPWGAQSAAPIPPAQIAAQLKAMPGMPAAALPLIDQLLAAK